VNTIRELYSKLYTEKLCIDCKEREGGISHFWNALGFDNFHDIAMPELGPLWDHLGQTNIFRWLRCHGVFRDNELDSPDWKRFAAQKFCLDRMLKSGMKPILELSRIPRPFANPNHPLGFCGDERGWMSFVSEFVTFLLNTYGRDEVQRWYFEFWNEPDHKFWAGDQPLEWRSHSNMQIIADYCRMYDWTAHAVRNVCPALRVGGPAAAGNSIFIREFLLHCREGANAATGGRGAPLDFFSCHVYSNSPERFPYMANILGRLLEVRDRVPQYYGKAIPILLTEWGITWGGGWTSEECPVEHRNTLYSAAFTLKLVKELIRFDFDVALFWGFSEWTWNRNTRTDFNGQRALFTNSHLERPAVAAYRLLDKLQGESCRVHRMTDTNNVDALCCMAAKRLDVVFWHHDPDPFGRAYPSKTEIILEHVPAGKAILRLEGWTREHNTYAEWVRLGRPRQPSEAQRSQIESFSRPKLLRDEQVVVESGMFATGEFFIHPDECYHLELRWE